MLNNKKGIYKVYLAPEAGEFRSQIFSNQSLGSFLLLTKLL